MAAATLLSSFLNRWAWMRKVMSGLARVPRRLLIVTISTPRVDQLGGVGVPQGVERHVRHPGLPAKEPQG
jgi:hypothetical protein